MKLTYLFIFSVLSINLVNCIDSIGTEFLTIFPWNNGGVNIKSNLSIDCINSDRTNMAKVTVYYNEFTVSGWDINIIYKNETISVDPLNSTRYTFPSSSVYQYLSQGVNRYPDTRIRIVSDNPISVIAHTYGPDGSGDSFTVMPTALAGYNYALSMPNPVSTAGSFAMIYMIPLTSNGNEVVNFKVITHTSTQTYTEKLFSDKSDVLMFAGPEKSFTFYASGNSKFVIVAAIRGLPISAINELQDFGCFMPTPVASTVCEPNSMGDIHLTELTSSNYFIASPPIPECADFNVQIFGSNTAQTSFTVSPRDVQGIQKWNNNQFGTNIGTYSNSAVLQMLRYGGYDRLVSGIEVGGFLDLMPSWTQYVTGISAFVVPRSNDQITIIGDLKTADTGRLDNQPISFEQSPYFSGMAYYAVNTISSGFHYFNSDGLYIIQIYGSVNRTAYGFTASYNRQQLMDPINITNPTTQTWFTTTTTSIATTSTTSTVTTSTTSPTKSTTTTTLTSSTSKAPSTSMSTVSTKAGSTQSTVKPSSSSVTSKTTPKSTSKSPGSHGSKCEFSFILLLFPFLFLFRNLAKF